MTKTSDNVRESAQFQYTVDFQWLELFWDHGNLF